ncbi:MAG TPA: ABC transporter permease [Fimbriimonas sp.]|nr:ABC transporter permease [Fimbriimonas sp.]
MKRFAAFRELGTVVLIVLAMVVAGIREPRFFKPESLSNILLYAPLLIVVGIGQMMVIVTRGIDVSVGSMVGISAMTVGMLFKAQPHMPLPLGVGVGILAGLLLGSLNGVLIAGVRIPPIIVTLGGLSAYRGLLFFICQGHQIDANFVPDGLTYWSQAGPITIAGLTISWVFCIAIAGALAAAWFLQRTRAGRDIYVLGSNPEAARLRGVPVRRTTFSVYAITGALCGLAGALYLSRYGVVNPGSAGKGMELVVIAAVVIGGTNVAGGSGSVLGVVLGCLLLGTISNALAVAGIDENWQQLTYGIIILVAVVVDTATKRALAKRLEAA